MRYKYYFCDLCTPALLDWLDKNRIKYKLVGGGVVPQLVAFSIFSSTSNCNDLLAQLDNANLKKPVITAEYTDAELADSDWLVIRPRKQCIDIINCREAYTYSCQWITPSGIKKAMHEKQQGILAIAKEPSIKTATAFWPRIRVFPRFLQISALLIWPESTI